MQTTKKLSRIFKNKWFSFKTIRLAVTMYVSIVVATAVSLDNFWLALTGVVSGMICMWVAKRAFQIKSTDEMLENLAGQAARLTYTIMVISLAITSVFLMFFGQQAFLKALGTVLSYLVLLMLLLYSLIYRFLLKQHS